MLHPVSALHPMCGAAHCWKYKNLSERRWCRHCPSFSGNQSYIKWRGTSHHCKQENGGKTCSCRVCLSGSEIITWNKWHSPCAMAVRLIGDIVMQHLLNVWLQVSSGWCSLWNDIVKQIDTNIDNKNEPMRSQAARAVFIHKRFIPTPWKHFPTLQHRIKQFSLVYIVWIRTLNQ